MADGQVSSANQYDSDSCVSSTKYEKLVFLNDQCGSVTLKTTGSWPTISGI